MADYWKSQARKYCDFCKCWISDNKPSVQFHENGKRHKAAVEARIKEISKKSIAAEKARVQQENDFKKMEEAAMKAYMRDVQENPDLSSRSLGAGDALPMSSRLPVERKKTEWHEAKTSEGEVYYWHSVTGESKWELPAEGFISLKDQSIKTTATANKKPPPKPNKRKHKIKDFKSKKHKSDKHANKQKIDTPVEVMGPIPMGKPFGDWKTIETKVEKPIDLQLPEPTHLPVKLSQSIEEEETRIEFKEKTVTLQLSGSGNTSGVGFAFKKTKFNRNNTRQRTSD